MNSQLNNSDYTKHSNSNWIEERKNDIGITSSFFHGGHGGTRRGINENDNVQWRVCSVRKRTGLGTRIT